MIHTGDCLDVMATLDAESVDAIVTDPPYGLEFMGKEWDRLWHTDETRERTTGRQSTSPLSGKPRYGTASRAMQQWHEAWAREAFRVAKPSAYLLAFGGTRTVHRLACAIEDAGWIIRDTLVWAYASGFPKSRASLKPAWEPIVMARKPGPLRMLAIDDCRIGTTKDWPASPSEQRGTYGEFAGRAWPVTGPTATIDRWDDDRNLCGSCAEGADSPARRGTPATKGSTTRKPAGLPLNASGMFADTSVDPATSVSPGMTAESTATSSSIDESGRTRTGRSRKASSSITPMASRTITGSRTCISCGAVSTPTTTDATRSGTGTGRPVPTTSGSTGSVGRWPANLLLTDPIFDGDVPGVVGGGETSSGSRSGEYSSGEFFAGLGPVTAPLVGDSGTYSRFFLVPKADRADREPVLGGLPLRPGGTLDGGEYVSEGRAASKNGTTPRANVHPTVKPTELMRHLVRLVTPPGGTVLDPFLGSGTTALACEAEGFEWIGIEREPEYVAIAEARLNGQQRGMGLGA